MNQGFYSLKQLVELTTLSRATIWRQCRANKFPRPVKLSGYRNGWLRKEVDAWVEARVEGRDQANKAMPTDLHFEGAMSGEFNKDDS